MSMAKGDSPYSTGFASGKIDYNLDPTAQMRKYKREEQETHVAPTTLPYEMGELPQHFADMVDSGMQACKILDGLLKNKNVKHKEELVKLFKNTEKAVLWFIQNVDPTLDKFAIGGSMEADDDDAEDED